MSCKRTFIQKVGDEFGLLWCIKSHFAAAEPVFFIREKGIEWNYSPFSGQIGRDMIRIGDADIWRRICCDVCDDIIIDFSIVRIQTKCDCDIGILFLKIADRFFIDICLRLVCVIFSPECDFIVL